MAQGNEIEIVITGNTRPVEQAFDRTENKARQVSSRIGEHFASLKGKMVTAGLALGGALVAGTMEAISQDAAAAKTAAALGLGPEEAKRYGKIAGQLYTQNFAGSVEEAQGALRAIHGAKLFEDDATDAELEAMTAKALNFANAFDQDINKSVRSVQQLIRNGLVKDADEGFDLITQGMREMGSAANDDILDTVEEYSTQFRELGISGPKAFGLITQAMRAGARDTDTVADAIKEFAIRSKDGSAVSRTSFQAIGLNADKMFQTFARGGPNADKAMKDVIARIKAMKDPVAQDAVAVGLFGTKSEDLQDALYALDPTTAVDALGEVKGAAERTGDAFNNAASNDLTVFWREAKQKVVDLAERYVVPALRGMARVIREDVVPAVKIAVQWLKENASWLVPTAIAILNVALAYKAYTVATNAATVASDLLNKTLRANPVGIVVAAVIALVTWLVTAYQTSGKFRDFVNGAFRKVGEFVGGVVNGIKAAWHAIETFFTETVPGWISSGFNAIVGAITGPFKAAFDWMKRAAQATWDTIQEIFTLGMVHTPTYNEPNGGVPMPRPPINAPKYPTYGSANKPRTRERAAGGILGFGEYEINERGQESLKGVPGQRLYNAQETARMGSGSGPVVMIAPMAAPGSDRELINVLLRLLRWEVRTTGRGDVQVLLGGVA